MFNFKLKSIAKVTILLGLLCSCSTTRRESFDTYELYSTEIGVDGTKVTLSRYPIYVSLLEDHLKSNSYYELSNALLREEPTVFKASAKLNWEKDKVFAGRSILLTLLYARDLWLASLSDKYGLTESAKHELQKSAAANLTYAFLVMVLDSPKCSDKRAEPYLRSQIFSKILKFNFSEILRVKQEFTLSERHQISDVAMALEQSTSSKRERDVFYCGNGVTDVRDDLTVRDFNPSRRADDPAKPILDVSYMPVFTTEDVWKPIQNNIRSRIGGSFFQVTL